jgi:predicted nucleic acid-binding protein
MAHYQRATDASGVLFSEDMHDGFRWRGVTIINPFTDDPSPVVRELLSKI